MNLHLGNIHACQSIPDGIAVMGVGTGVDHDPLRSVRISLLDPVDDGSFMVALEHLDLLSGFFCFFVDQIQ